MVQTHRTAYPLPSIRQVTHGIGALDALPGILAEAGAARAVVITSPSVRATRLMAEVATLCGRRLAGIFSGTVAHNPAATLGQAAEAVRAANADAIITVGGGTAIDAGKAVKLLICCGASQTFELTPWVTTRSQIGLRTLPRSAARDVPIHIAIPTTLSGAEFSHGCAVTNDATLEKQLFVYDELHPEIVLLDPAATKETPARLWVSTGVKAMDHAVEQGYARDGTPVITALCLEGLRLLHTNLPRTLAEPADNEVRLACLYAKWMVTFGIRMNVMQGLSHGIGHQIGPRWQVPHGITSGVTLPLALRFNRACTLAVQQRMAEAIGLPVSGVSAEAAAEAFAAEIEAFVQRMGLPSRLQEVGGRPQDFPDIARDVVRDPVVASNPRPVDSEAEVVELLWHAWRAGERHGSKDQSPPVSGSPRLS